MSHVLITVLPFIEWPGNWIDLLKVVDGCSHEMRIIAVSWKPPMDTYLKLNMDGSALSNPGKIGRGGIL